MECIVQEINITSVKSGRKEFSENSKMSKRLDDIDKFGEIDCLSLASLIDSSGSITFDLVYQLTEQEEYWFRLTSSTNRPTTLSAP